MNGQFSNLLENAEWSIRKDDIFAKKKQITRNSTGYNHDIYKQQTWKNNPNNDSNRARRNSAKNAVAPEPFSNSHDTKIAP